MTLTTEDAQTGGRRAAPRSRLSALVSGAWATFAFRRLGGLALTFILAVVLTFSIVPLIPGDPAVAAAGPDANQAAIEQARLDLGLDEPLLTRFGHYVGGVLQLDLGHSFSLNQPVSDVVLGRLPYTMMLAFLALLVVLLVAVPVGMSVAIATRGGRRHRLDAAFGYITAFVASVPPYVMATLLVVVFAVTLQALPPAYSQTQLVASLVMPVLALSFHSACTVSRVVRRETLVVLENDYMRTARGWRLPAHTLYLRHALPNLLTSTLTISGMTLIGMLSGAVTVETVFNWPGLGLGIVEAVQNKDYPLIQGIVLILAMIGALLTIVVDLILGIFDPRTLDGRHE